MQGSINVHEIELKTKTLQEFRILSHIVTDRQKDRQTVNPIDQNPHIHGSNKIHILKA